MINMIESFRCSLNTEDHRVLHLILILQVLSPGHHD